jgi:hypothetical protein
MVDIQTISVTVASAGVFAAAIYYIFQIRHQTRLRQTELVSSLYSTVKTREYMEAWEKFKTTEIAKDLHEYRKKHGLVELNMVLTLYDQVGVLLRRKLIDVGLVQDFFGPTVIDIWEKLKPLFKNEEEQTGKPHVYQAIEYLYSEMKKREQKLQQSKG